MGVLVDGYYDPFNVQYQNTLRECLRVMKASNRCAGCEIHHLDLRDSPSAEAIEREAKAKFNKVIPPEMTVTIFRWSRKTGGADFHARYLLTDRGGIRVDAGFQAKGGGRKTDMMLMDFALSQATRSKFNRAAGVYELVEPVLKIDSNGDVQHI
jgi:hypothetical protein